MGYNADITAYKAQIDNDISTQSLPNSIPPDVVGSGYTDLADLLAPYINSINNQGITSGSGVPSALSGNELDLYYRVQPSSFELYRKESGAWVLKVAVPFGIVLPDGPATLRTTIASTTVTVTPGGWFISNVVYNKATQTLFSVPAADLNFYRNDLIYADTSNQILYLTGTPSLTPVTPTLPANTIMVDTVIAPSVSADADPYLLFGGGSSVSVEDAILNQNSIVQTGDFRLNGAGTFELAGFTSRLSADELLLENTVGDTFQLHANGFVMADAGGFQLTVDKVGPLTANQTLTIPDTTGTLTTKELSAENSTGALTYAGISVVDGTHVNIGACTGEVIDNETDPANPVAIAVNYAGELNKLVTTVGSGLATYVLLNSSGVIVFQNTFPTSAQRKTHIYLSKIAHPAGTITVAGNEVDFITSPLSQHRDLFQAINYINNGVTASAIGASLTFATTTGVVTGDGINFVADKTNPNDLTIAPQSPCTFLPRTQTGAGGAATTTVDVANYDVAGTVTAIPGGGNTSTLKYIFLVPGLGFIVQYGQTTYASLTDAIAQVGKESFVIYPSLVRNSILIGVLAAKKSATALNNTADAQFFRADKFGQAGGSSAGVAVGTMQTAYNNSLQPQITTTTALGAVQWKRGSAADTDNVVQVLNGAGTAVMSVTGNGLMTAQGYNAGGSFTPTAGIARGNNLTPALTATANNDTLIGLDMNPTFALGAFTGVLNFGQRITAQTALLYVGRNTQSTSRGVFSIFDDTNARTMEVGIKGSASTDSASFAANGEVFLRSSGGAQGLVLSCANGNIRLITTGSGTEQARMVGTNGNILLNTTTDDTTSKLQVNGIIRTLIGAESLKVGTNTGNPDHAYMGFYARTATPTTRSGLMGYATSGGTALTVLNSLNNATIDLQTTGTSSYIRFLSPFGQFGGSNVRLDLGASSFASQTNMVLLDVSLADVTSGNKINGRTSRGSLATRAATLSGDSFLGIYGYGQHGVPEADTSAQVSIVCSATENWSPTNRGSKWEVFTTPNASTTLTKAAEFNQDGSFLYKFASAASDPTATEIPAGFVKLYKNTTSGVLKLWANDGGTLKSVTLT